MTDSSITFEVEGNTQRKLERLSTLLGLPAMGGFLKSTEVQLLQERAAARFGSEGDDASGGKWQPLSEGTKHMRELMGFGPGPINFRTGELRRFMTSDGGDVKADPSGDVWLSFPGSEPEGELLQKFQRAQKGDSKAPARPVAVISVTDLAQTMTALEGYITAGMA